MMLRLWVWGWFGGYPFPAYGMKRWSR